MNKLKVGYLNGKVVCEKSSCNCWTVGKVYDVVDGIITNDDGCRIPCLGAEPYKDFDDVRHAGSTIGDIKHNYGNEFKKITIRRKYHDKH